MTDIEIPDNEYAAFELEDIANPMDRRGSSGWAYICRGAARRLRADAEEIARLEAKCAEQQRALEWYSVGHCEKHEARIAELEAALATAQTEAAAQRELATLLERESSDPLTRIAAALERPSREWVAALALVGAARDCPTYESTAISAFKFADALLAEMGEG